ncbi:MAG: hypothetical protein PHQ75_15135, partial [Thermoguttaceae bacterium]|nr:hypothetical protein [Thermoguttaceae bacterium]
NGATGNKQLSCFGTGYRDLQPGACTGATQGVHRRGPKLIRIGLTACWDSLLGQTLGQITCCRVVFCDFFVFCPCPVEVISLYLIGGFFGVQSNGCTPRVGEV